MCGYRQISCAYIKPLKLFKALRAWFGHVNNSRPSLFCCSVPGKVFILPRTQAMSLSLLSCSTSFALHVLNCGTLDSLFKMLSALGKLRLCQVTLLFIYCISVSVAVFGRSLAGAWPQSAIPFQQFVNNLSFCLNEITFFLWRKCFPLATLDLSQFSHLGVFGCVWIRYSYWFPPDKRLDTTSFVAQHYLRDCSRSLWPLLHRPGAR